MPTLTLCIVNCALFLSTFLFWNEYLESRILCESFHFNCFQLTTLSKKHFKLNSVPKWNSAFHRKRNVNSWKNNCFKKVHLLTRVFDKFIWCRKWINIFSSQTICDQSPWKCQRCGRRWNWFAVCCWRSSQTRASMDKTEWWYSGKSCQYQRKFGTEHP